jgi:eukaryotic-like serine/threonine-protein kinase
MRSSTAISPQFISIWRTPRCSHRPRRLSKRSLELSPSYAAYANLAGLYLQQKRYAESAALSEKALQLNGQDATVWNNLANAYEALKQTDKAGSARDRQMQLLEEAVKLQPRDSETHAQLGFLYARKKLRDKALVEIQAALALAPDDPNVLVNVAEAYENLGERRLALRYAEEGLKKGYRLQDLKDDPDSQALVADPSFRPNGK